MSLQSLLTTPRQTIEETNFFVDYTKVPGPLGGGVSIECTYISGLNFLTLKPGGTHYYFPYNSTGMAPISGIGTVQVPTPIRQPTIAVTGAMNGCSLDVYLNEHGYTFVHDLNGRNANNLKNPGTRVCRIEASAYWPDPNIKKHNGSPTVPICQFLCVYTGGFWHVGCFGIYTGYNKKTRKNTDLVGTYLPRGGKYRGFFNDTLHLIQR